MQFSFAVQWIQLPPRHTPRVADDSEDPTPDSALPWDACPGAPGISHLLAARIAGAHRATDHGIDFCADDSLAKCQTRTPVPIKRTFGLVGVGQRCNQSCAAFEAGKLPSHNGMTGSDSQAWVMLRIGRSAVQSHKRVGVGIWVAPDPLHGSGRAGFPHPALTSGNDAHGRRG